MSRGSQAEDLVGAERSGNWPFLEERHDLKKIRGRPRTYRIRVGRVRAILAVDKEGGEILVLKIEERERAYR